MSVNSEFKRLLIRGSMNTVGRPWVVVDPAEVTVVEVGIVVVVVTDCGLTGIGLLLWTTGCPENMDNPTLAAIIATTAAEATIMAFVRKPRRLLGTAFPSFDVGRVVGICSTIGRLEYRIKTVEFTAFARRISAVAKAQPRPDDSDETLDATNVSRPRPRTVGKINVSRSISELLACLNL